MNSVKKFLRAVIFLLISVVGIIFIGIMLWNSPLFWKAEYQAELLAGTAVSALENVGTTSLLPTISTNVAQPAGGFELVTIDPAIAGDVKLVGDIDGDGFPDLVIGGMPDEKLNWYRYPDWDKTIIATPGTEFTTDGALGDMDHDGDLDIVVPDGRGTNNLVWYKNPLPNGNPSNGNDWIVHPIGSTDGWAKDVFVADFDDNDRLDVATRRDDQAMIFFQSEAGAWTKMAFDSVDLGTEGMAGGDVDGDDHIDLVLHGVWVRNPGGAAAQSAANWTEYVIGTVDNDFKALVADVNNDSQMDVLFSSSEGTADVDWWTPANGDPTGTWTKETIVPSLNRAHTLQAADMDLDGDTDVVIGQMHTSSEQEIMVLYNLNGSATQWQKKVIDDTGLHNGVVADIGNDGDFDIFGANWTGNPPVKLWVNHGSSSSGGWTYKQVTDEHARTFGLAFGDMNADGRKDIAAGLYWYRNPGTDMTSEWTKTPFPNDMHAILTLDVDGDDRADVIAQKNEGDVGLYWLEATNANGDNWTAVNIGTVPEASHILLGAQGYRVANLEGSPKPQILISSGNGIYYFRIPANPETGNWPRVHVNANPSDEGFAAGDMDADGDLDIAATTGRSKRIEWYQNPGNGTENWTAVHIGDFSEALFPDRTEIADLNNDDKLDIIVTEENGEESDAKTFWWVQPETPTATNWERRPITNQGTTNSMDVADMDADGDTDIILAEHRGPLKLAIWSNDGSGSFTESIIDSGKESHLGARTEDLDNDGDLDIVSIAYDAPHLLHLWINNGSSNNQSAADQTSATATAPPAHPTAIPQQEAAATTSAEEPQTTSIGSLQALYTFEKNDIKVVQDVSGNATPSDLIIADVTAVTWLSDGGISIDSPTILTSSVSGTELAKNFQKTGAITLEVWLKPDNIDQDGPARIITFSEDPLLRNFTLGQEYSSYDVRLRTTESSTNGQPSLATNADMVTTDLTHVVYTRDAAGTVVIYIDSQESSRMSLAGDFSNWDGNYKLALANELTMDRPWLGELHLVAIYNKALTTAEVNQNYQAGTVLTGAKGETEDSQSQTETAASKTTQNIEAATESETKINSATNDDVDIAMAVPQLTLMPDNPIPTIEASQAGEALRSTPWILAGIVMLILVSIAAYVLLFQQRHKV